MDDEEFQGKGMILVRVRKRGGSGQESMQGVLDSFKR